MQLENAVAAGAVCRRGHAGGDQRGRGGDDQAEAEPVEEGVAHGTERLAGARAQVQLRHRAQSARPGGLGPA
ncbi:hypothetical protein ACFVW8_29310, partial [Streptomyces sp. NPDC058221]|uniref:hypothetical protein n=1 Tax=Streptomyces sp. NPDC058221 TaxID=3346388 RepID=UPI0036F118CA